MATAPQVPEYFTRAIQSALESEKVAPAAGRIGDLLRAGERAKQSLQADYVEAKKRELARENSWVGKLDLDSDSLTGQVVNTAASLYSGATRLAGDVAGFLTADIEAMLTDASISEEDKQAIGRYARGEASNDDLVRINQTRVDEKGFHFSPLQRAQLATNARNRSAGIEKAFDTSANIHQDNRQALSRDLGANFESAWGQVKSGADALWNGGKPISGAADVATGLAKLIYNAGEAAVTNPAAATEYVAENIPQLAIGAFGKAGRAALGLSNVSYASENYQKGIAKYQAENNGAYPDEAKRMEMAAAAASLALAEHVGDATVLKGALRAANKAGVTDDAARAGFKQSLLNVGKATGTGVATEAATEGYQTWAEGVATLDPASAQQIYEGAVIGGIAGGGMAGGGRALGEITKSAAEGIEANVVKEAVRETKKAAQQAAIDSGDITPLVTKDSPFYDPSRAIAALAGNSAKEGVTEEVKQANLQKAQQIVTDLEEQKATHEENLSLTTPAGIARLKNLVAKFEEQGKQEKADAVKEMLTAAETASPEYVKSLKDSIAQTDTLLTKAKENLGRFNTQLNPETQQSASAPINQDADVEALATGLNTEIDTADQVAVADRVKKADEVINLSMVAPRKLSAETAASLASNANNGLSELQRKYLREFSAARVAENKAKDEEAVKKDVFVGGKGYIGLDQYRNQIGTALSVGNRKLADERLKLLSKFEADHKQKAEIVNAAWENGKGFGLQVVKDKRTGWKININEPLEVEELRKNGGLELKSIKLIDAINAEAAAITATLQELTTAHGLKFNTQVSGVASNVQNVSATPAVPQANQSSQGNQETANTGSNTAAAVTPPATTSVVGGAGSSNVETTGVTNDPVTGFVNALDTDDTYQAWSNVRDGSDRANLRELITSSAKAVMPAISNGTATRELLESEFKSQKWFRSATPEQRTAAIDALLSAAPVTPSTPAATTGPESFANHSGGAVGADSMFDTIGKSLGFTKQNHYWHGKKTPKGNVQLTDDQLNEGIAHAKKAAAFLKRPWNERNASLLGRNWFQVKNADQVIAIAPLVQPGEPDSSGKYTSKASRTTVDGGTGYAVEMAIAAGKEVHVFDTKSNQWHTWDGKQFVKSTVPTLARNYAGIGSRQKNGKMTKESIQAIKDVYEKALGRTPSTPPAPAVTSPPAAQTPVAPQAAETPPQDKPAVDPAKETQRWQDELFASLNSTEAKEEAPKTQEKLKLNEGQQAAYDAVIEFLRSKDMSFSIIGSAGTGKTTIVKTILDNLRKEGLNDFSNVVLSAPTHRANAVTRYKTPSATVLTLHSLLGLSAAVDLENFDAKDLKFVRGSIKEDGKLGKMPKDGLLIVDESSMINDELFTALIESATEENTKIIFLGDSAQLGPVKQKTDSKALTSTSGKAVLTQVMRAKNAALLNESVNVRTEGNFSATNTMSNGNGVAFLKGRKKFLEIAVGFFKSEEFKKNPLLVRVLAFRNDMVTQYNQAIRKAIFGENAASYEVGDLLMGYAAFGEANRSTGMPPVSNGIDYIVTKVSAPFEGKYFDVPVKMFRIIYEDVYGLTSPTSLEIVDPQTPPETIAAIAQKANAMLEAAKRDRKKWRDYYTAKEAAAIPFDLKINVGGKTTNLVVKTLDYGYAHTIHKSQGGTYTYSMVDARDVEAARTDKDKERLRYVGLTRAEKGAVVLTDQEITYQGTETTPEEPSNASAAQETPSATGQGQSTSTAPVTSAAVAPTTPAAPTADNNAPSESAEQTSETGTPETPAAVVEVDESPGGLSVLKEKHSTDPAPDAPLGAIYRTINRVRAWLSQQRTTIDENTNTSRVRPLVEFTKLLSNLHTGIIDIESLFGNGELDTANDPEGKRKKALETFLTFAKGAYRDARSNFIKGSLTDAKGNKASSDQLFRDPIQDFFDKDGKIDENIVTAVIYGAYSWFSDEVFSTGLKSPDDLMEMHGIDKDANYMHGNYRRLQEVSTFQDTAINAIGNIAVAALGLSANKKATVEYMNKVKTALGTHGLRVLLDADLISVDYIPQKDINFFFQIETDKSVPDTVVNTYIKLNRDWKSKDLKLNTDAQLIKDTTSGSGDIVNKLFGSERAPKEALDKPAVFKQKYKQGTKQKVGKRLTRVLNKAQQQEHRIIPAMWRTLSAIGDKAYLTAAGWKELDSTKIQAQNRNAVEAQNLNLENQLYDMKDLVNGALEGDKENGLSKPFFVTYSVWLNSRVGIATRNLNPQSSKIHRFSFFRPEWEATFDTNDKEQVAKFEIAFAQAIGIKIDQQGNEKTLEKLKKQLIEDENDRTLELARRLYEATHGGTALTAEEQKAIGEYAAAAEGMQTLQALVAYGEYLDALDNGKPTFTVQMLVGVDGKTNGPILSHLALGAARTASDLFKFINRGGMYRTSDKVRNYNHWYENEQSLDLYEDLARAMLTRLKGSVELQALYVITKDLLKDGKVTSAGRKIVKTPLTAFAFGSSISTSMQGMQKAFLESVINRIEDVVTGKETKVSKAELIRSINTLMKLGDPELKAIPENASDEDLMDWKFSPRTAKALTGAFDLVIGEAANNTMEEYFAVFNQRRNAVNGAIQLGFNIYSSIYGDLRRAEFQRLMDAGEIAYVTINKGTPKEERIPFHDMRIEQEEALKASVSRILPRIHTIYSQEENDIDYGMLLTKTEKFLSQSQMDEVRVQFGRPYNGFKGESRQIIANAMRTREISPGVSGLPYMMHSLDSYVMHTSIEGTEALNVHDETANGADKTEKIAQSINRSAFKAMLEYSPSLQAFNLFERAVLSAAVMKAEGRLSERTLGMLSWHAKKFLERAGIKLDPKEDALHVALQLAKAQQYEADRVRLQALSEMAYMDQYTWEGGEYAVTEDDRKEALTRLAALEKSGKGLSPNTVKALASLTFSGKLAPARDFVIDVPVVVPAEVQADPVPKTSPFGPLGTPILKSAPELVEFFEENPKTTAEELIKVLHKLISKTPDSAYSLKLLQAIKRLVPPNLMIHVVDKNTTANDVLVVPDTSIGWFTQLSKDEQAIYAVGQDFQHSYLTPETFLHELVHAAISHRLRDDAAQPYHVELSMMLDAINEYVKKNKLVDKNNPPFWLPALDSVDELVAYGMTNREFQALLSKIEYKSTHTIRNALKAFINLLSRLLGFKDASSANALGTLITNVSAVFELQGNANRGGGTNSMAAVFTVPNTLDIHNALNGDGLSAGFNDKLTALMEGIVFRLHGPFGVFKNDVMQRNQQTGFITPEDIWFKAQADGLAPLQLEVRGSLIKATERELHAMEQVEATVRIALERPDTATRTAYKELDDLFLEMKDKIKPSDFNDPQAHDFIFGIRPGPDGKSHHLARFAAFALAHEGFNKLMQQSTDATRKLRDGVTFAEKVQIIFDKLLAFLAERITQTYRGQKADEKLEKLITQLVDIEAKKQLSIRRATESKGMDLVSVADNISEKGAQKLVDAVKAVATSRIVADSRSKYVQLAGAMVRIRANDQVDQLFKTINDFRDKNFPGLQGLPMEVLNQIRGIGQTFNLLQLLSTKTQANRKHIITQTSKAVMAAFKDGGEYFSTLSAKDKGRAAKEAVTQVFMRTGMHVLMDQYSLTDMHRMLTNPIVLDQAIAAATAQFNDHAELQPYSNHYQHMAQALGYFRVTGEVKVTALTMNAHNIARLYATNKAGRIKEAEAQLADPIIEKLVTLYALKYSKDKSLAARVLDIENNRGGPNGIEFVLRTAKRFEQESKDKLFRRQDALFMHGYTPEIYNQGTVIAVANEEEGKDLLAQGYTKGKRVQIDKAHPTQEVRHMYILKDGGLARYQTGIVSLSGKRAKGSQQHSGFLNVNTDDGFENTVFNMDVAAAKPGGLASGPLPDLTQRKEIYMAPVVNPQGAVVNWRYLMNDQTKDEVLERDSRIENVMGVLAGSIYDKQSTTEVNAKTFDALKEIYNDEWSLNPDSFVLIGPKSTDAKLREIWDMLPNDTKNMARARFGKDGMLVRKDMLTPVFGYRQYSLADMFKKEPELRSFMEKIIAGFVEQFFVGGAAVGMLVNGKPLTYAEAKKQAKKAAIFVTRFEKGWQEIVHEVKDIIVVKSVEVLIDNILSNWSYLMMYGVPLKDILRNHMVALRGSFAYERDKEKLDQLQLQLDAGTAPAGTKDEIARLKDALMRNPVSEMVEAGLMPTIVEDIAADEASDPYSYKSQFVRYMEGMTSRLNPTVVSALKQVYMAHDTKIYQVLSRGTKLSDFVARYTYFEHLKQQKGKDGKPMPKEEIIHKTSEAFVNYDSPLPKELQYLDVMGIVPFTKYYIRIQRVLLDLIKQKPGRVLTTLLVDNFVNLGPIVLDSSLLHRVGNNPFQWGAAQLPGKLDDLGTIAAATAIVK